MLILSMMVSSLAGCSSKTAETTGETVAQEEAVEVSTEQKVNEVQETKEVTVEVSELTLSEAPMLAEQVTAGTLPTVEERMPVMDDIMIEPVFDSVGTYGGGLEFPWRGEKSKWTLEKVTNESLFRFTLDGSGVEPNVAKGYDVNEDATEYLIYLREGMKWSDGVDFTADDVVFYYNEMVLKETFGKSPYACYYSINSETGEKTLAEVTKVDDYTVKVAFADPSVLFLERLAIDVKWFWAPKHYIEKLLPHIVGEEEALKQAEAMGYSDVATLGKYTGYYFWAVPDRPTLRAWQLSTDIEAAVAVWERNPYYFKMDESGQQLPYIDSIDCLRVESGDHVLLEGIAGNVDIQVFGIDQFTLLLENKEAGDYDVTQWSSTQWSGTGIQLNQATPDEKLREVFQDIRFREALSVAVDRVEYAALVTDGLGQPHQFSVPEGLTNYVDGWAEKWTEYDTDRANALLDEMGMAMGDDGFRTYSDGSEFELNIYQVEADATSEMGEKEALLQKYYEEVGIKTNIKVVDKTYGEELKSNNELTAQMSAITAFNVALRPDNLVPIRNYNSWYGAFGTYNESGGTAGIKPEGDMALLLEYFNKSQAATAREDVDMYAQKIIDLHMKNQWIVGYTTPEPRVVMVSNDLQNVPDSLIYCDEFRDYGHAKFSQFYLTRD